MNDFPKRLRTALERRNISQTVLAESMNVNKSLITRYMQGKCLPKTSNLISICKILSVSPAYLMGDSEVLDDVGGMELVKFMKKTTPEIDTINDLTIEERHCAYIYGECTTLSLSDLEKVEDYIKYIKSKK